MKDPCWSLDQCAEFLQCSTKTVRKMMRGGFPHFYVGRRPRFRPEAVREWVHEQERSRPHSLTVAADRIRESRVQERILRRAARVS